MFAAQAAAWSLITLTFGGEVREAPFTTEALCLQGKSIALYGMTIEEKAKADADRATEAKAWDDANPWREPKTKAERANATRAASERAMISFMALYSAGGWTTDVQMLAWNGKVREVNPFRPTTQGRFVPSDLQRAWCLKGDGQ